MNVQNSSRFVALDGHIYHNCLGISYLMSKYGLSIKLTHDVGREFSEEDAQELIDQFYDVFSGLGPFQEGVIDTYNNRRFLKLKCGWYHWGDNDNARSVTNCPTQGAGASIMRKAVDLAASKGVKVIKTLHDAIYIEGDIGKEIDILHLRDSMREAFIWYFEDDPKFAELAANIRLDPFAWSPSYKPDSTIKIGKEKWEVPVNNLYLDERAIREYEMFKKYFNKPVTDIL